MNHSLRHARRLAAHLLCLAGLALAGCGTLDVRMQVLDPAVVRNFLDAELSSRLLPQIVASTPESLRNQVDRLHEQHREAYRLLADGYRREAAKLPDGQRALLVGLADALVTDFNQNPKQRAFYEGLRAGLVADAGALRQLLGSRQGLARADPDHDRMMHALRTWQQRVAQAERVIADDIRSSGRQLVSALPGAAGAAVLQNLVAGPLAVVHNELAQLSVQNSPTAYVVANADDSQWATRYNHVVARSAGGASDVAIRLDQRTGNYLLKGLSFDPADVAAVAAKVTTQTLLLSAQAAGVPVKTAAPPTDGTTGKALAATSGALADAQAATEASRARAEARRAALVALAQTIVGEEKDLAGDDATRRAAMAAIRNALDQRLVLIRPAGTP
jgi:hypothetical protein